MLFRTLNCNLSHIVVHHDLHKFLECCRLRIPSKLILCLCGITEQINYIGRSVEIGRYFNKHLTGCLIHTFFIHSFTGKLKLDPGIMECQLTKFPYRMLNSRCNDEVLGLVLL